MELKARRISGSPFSAEDRLDVTFDSDGEDMSLVIHTIEQISGVAVTHGGGAPADEYLHYKNLEADANADGIIDYSNVEMHLVQAEQGTSVIKVVCSAITVAQVTAKEDNGTTVTPTIYKTGALTLEWHDDGFV
jgi:hypothetical protein|tara:strand:- start:45 stop:446 length:402 start_codon:yes stop_codon:yes gene_type:complete